MEKRDVKINQNRMKSGDFVRTLWVATVEMGVTREDIKDPGFWSHVASQLRPYDRMEVRCDDGTFFAEYLVIACERTYAKVKELSWVSLTSKDVAQTQEDREEFSYKYRGPHSMHSIIRKSDNKVMVEHKATKEDAMKWLSEYKQTIA